jgi:hypothetical protein
MLKRLPVTGKNSQLCHKHAWIIQSAHFNDHRPGPQRADIANSSAAIIAKIPLHRHLQI